MVQSTFKVDDKGTREPPYAGKNKVTLGRHRQRQQPEHALQPTKLLKVENLERLAESLFRADDWIWPGSWSRDATALAFTRVSAATNGAGADPVPACYGRGGVCSSSRSRHHRFATI